MMDKHSDLDTVENFGSESSSKQACTQSSRDSKVLPEELVETIISRIPFPFIMRSRCLSKGWLSRLSVPDGALQRNFQRQVTLASPSWPTFCPVFVSDGMILGYDRGNQKWLKMKMHPFSTKSIEPPNSAERRTVHPYPVVLFGGALICQVLEIYVGQGCQVIVSNVVTGSTRYLPQPPVTPQARGHIGVIGEAKMFHVLPGGYEVVLVDTLINEHAAEERPAYSLFLYIQLYSSKTTSWLARTVFFDPTMPYERCVYLVKCSPCEDGFIYILFFHESQRPRRRRRRQYLLEVVAQEDPEGEAPVEHNSLLLWSYRLSTGQWAKYKIDPIILTDYDSMTADQVACSVLMCGSRIVMVDVITWGDSMISRGGRKPTFSSIRVRVSQLDGKTEEMEAVSESPMIQIPSIDGVTTMRRATRFVADEERIYVYFMMMMEISVQVYNVGDKSWSTLPFPQGSVRDLCRATTWVQSAFSPGAFTFSMV